VGILARSLSALAILILAAHFFRAGSVGLVLVCVGLWVLLFIRRRWAMRVLQVGLLLGALEWGRTLVLLVMHRRAAGLPSLRLAVILGTVALFTGGCALLLSPRPSREGR
jgi:hypothetical protein